MTLLGPLDFSRPHSPPTEALSIEAWTRSDIHALTLLLLLLLLRLEKKNSSESNALAVHYFAILGTGFPSPELFGCFWFLL